VGCTTDACDEVNDVVTHTADNSACDNGLFCDGAEPCDAVNDCQAGTAPTLDDGVNCTTDACDEDNDVVTHTADNSACDNGAFCDGAETCDVVNDCQAGTAVDCSGGTDQCNTGFCDEGADQCDATPQPSGTTCDDGDSCTGTDICDGSGSCGGVPICLGPSLETFTLTTGAGWTTHNLASSYTSMVVVCAAGYDNSSAPAVIRVRNAAGSSVDIAAARVDAARGLLAGVNAHCMVVEEGSYTAAEHGVTMEAVKYVSSVTDRRGSWVGQSRSYANTYSSPVVVGQVMTANDAEWSVFWARGSSRTVPPSASNLWTGKNVSEDSNTSRADETVGYVVIEAGNGTMDGRAYTAAVGADSIRGMTTNGAPWSYSLSGLATASTAVVSTAAMDGGNGGWPVLYGAAAVSAAELTLVFDEDQLRDSERAHTHEQVAYIVFE